MDDKVMTFLSNIYEKTKPQMFFLYLFMFLKPIYVMLCILLYSGYGNFTKNHVITLFFICFYLTFGFFWIFMFFIMLSFLFTIDYWNYLIDTFGQNHNFNINNFREEINDVLFFYRNKIDNSKIMTDVFGGVSFVIGKINTITECVLNLLFNTINVLSDYYPFSNVKKYVLSFVKMFYSLFNDETDVLDEEILKIIKINDSFSVVNDKCVDTEKKHEIINYIKKRCDIETDYFIDIYKNHYNTSEKNKINNKISIYVSDIVGNNKKDCVDYVLKMFSETEIKSVQKYVEEIFELMRGEDCKIHVNELIANIEDNLTVSIKEKKYNSNIKTYEETEHTELHKIYDKNKNKDDKKKHYKKKR